MSARIPELLAPAGNLEKLITAFAYGADAVYVGLKQLSLRSYAENFTLEELKEGCSFAHARGKKVYAALNAFVRDDALAGLDALMSALEEAGADAVILSDPGVLRVARAHSLPMHLSTQANTLNASAALFWKEQGIGRVILARELTLPQIENICKTSQMEVEVFIHGAMCVSYSGRCVLSNYLTGRDANAGECAQPCRYRYHVREAGTDGLPMTLEEDEAGSFLFNARDLMLIEHLPALIRAGVHSLKIEGRMKTAYYAATVVNAYRMALDAYADALGKGRPYVLDGRLAEELHKISHRPYSCGFLPGTDPGQSTDCGGYTQGAEVCALVLDYDAGARRAGIEQRNRFFEGDTLEILSPGDIGRRVTVRELRDEEGMRVSAAPHPKQRLSFLSQEALRPGDMLRKPVEPGVCGG